jgi:hypothetical protein
MENKKSAHEVGQMILLHLESLGSKPFLENNHSL